MANPSSLNHTSSTQLALRILEHLRSHPAAVKTFRLADLVGYLQTADAKLHQLVSARGRFTESGIDSPDEFSAVLFQLHNDFPVLAKALNLPPPKVTAALLAVHARKLIGSGIPTKQGDIAGFGKYELLDPGWVKAFLHCMATYANIPEAAKFGDNPAHINVPAGKTITLALAGDWGTGEWTDGRAKACPASQVSMAMATLGPFDFTVHLSDVYYSGTIIEESDSLQSLWPKGTMGSFALNSNHEMYSGAWGYYDTLAKSQFCCQQGTSYFCIETDGWIVLGLDSAYFSKSLLYLNGALDDELNNIQGAFARACLVPNKKLLVLTHHNGLDLEGITREPLWELLRNALGRMPDFWYWGHLHQGVIYHAINETGNNQNGIRARCIGHGGLPVQRASVLSGSANIEHYQPMPITDPGEDQTSRIMNGFAVLTLGPGTAISEVLYSQDGLLRWSSSAPRPPQPKMVEPKPRTKPRSTKR